MGKTRSGGRWQKTVIAAAAALALTAGFVPTVQAQSVFEWICDEPTCNGDPGFGFTITFAPGVAAPDASFTGVAGNVTAATLTSGVGDGFALTLADLIETGTTTNDRSNFQVTFDSSGTQVRNLLDASEGTNLSFFAAGVARLDVLEGSDFGYSIQLRQDLSPVEVSDTTPVTGRLVLVVPEAPTAGVLYDVDFDGEVVGAPPGIHPAGAAAPREQVSLVSGDPTVVASFGTLTGQPLAFDSFGDQVQDFVMLNMLDLPGGPPASGLFVYEADVEIQSGLLFPDSFSINLQGPDDFQLSLDFLPGADPTQGVAAVERAGEGILNSAPYAFDTKITVRIEADLSQDAHRVLLDGALISSGRFGASEIWRSFIQTRATGARAGIDNIVVSTGPSTEFAACPFDEATVRADCAATQSGFYIVHSIVDTQSPPAACPCPEGSPSPVVTRPCVDGPGEDSCFSETAIVRRASEETIMNISRNPTCTIYCYSLDGIRICQEFCLPD